MLYYITVIQSNLVAAALRTTVLRPDCRIVLLAKKMEYRAGVDSESAREVGPKPTGFRNFSEAQSFEYCSEKFPGDPSEVGPPHKLGPEWTRNRRGVGPLYEVGPGSIGDRPTPQEMGQPADRTGNISGALPYVNSADLQ